jgi:hypothetical protein
MSCTIGCLAVLVLSCVKGGATSGEAHSGLRGTVVDTELRPLPGAVVTLCPRADDERVSVNEGWPACDATLPPTLVSETGAFELPRPVEPAALAEHALVIRQPGFATRLVQGAQLDALARDGGRLVLERAPKIQLTLVEAGNGAPIAGASFGWFVQDGPVLRIRSIASDPGPTGRVESTFEDVPGGELWVFAIAPGDAARYALARVELRAGVTQPIELVAREVLRTIRGAVTTSEGEPLAGAISMASVETATGSLFDRVLGILQGGRTDTGGRFSFRVTSSAAQQVRFAAWIPGSGTSESHVAETVLASVDVPAGSESAVLSLRAEQVRTVACSLRNEDGAAVGLAELGLSFGRHVGWRHSGSCVAVRSDPEQAEELAPSVVRFVWPEGAAGVLVQARSVELPSPTPGGPPRVLTGVLELPTTDGAPCQIQSATTDDEE